MNTPADPATLDRPMPDRESMAHDERVVRTGFWRKVRSTLGRVPFTEDIVASWYCAVDPRTPAWVRAMLMGALAYFVTPADLIPDFVVGLGYTDDAAVLMAALSAVRQHLRPEHRSCARSFLDGDDRPQNLGREP